MDLGWQVLDAVDTPHGPSVRQSTFLSHMFSPKALAHAAALDTPAPNTQMMIDRDCLALVGDGRTLDEIARTLQEPHPEHLPTHQAALDHAAPCLGRYNRA